jgi:hypothetical protein
MLLLLFIIIIFLLFSQNNELFIDNSYNNYVINFNNDEYILVTYYLLSDEIKQTLVTKINNQLINISKNINDIDILQKMLDRGINKIPLNDLVFAIKKSDLNNLKIIKNSSILAFNNNGNFKYISDYGTLNNISNVLHDENNDKIEATLFIDPNNTLTLTVDPEDPEQKVSLNPVNIENNKINNNFVSLEKINDIDIYQLVLSKNPTDITIVKTSLNI